MKRTKIIFLGLHILLLFYTLQCSGKNRGGGAKFLIRDIKVTSTSDYANMSFALKMKSGIKVLDADLFVYKNLDKNVFLTIELSKLLSDNPKSNDYKFVDRQFIDICSHARGDAKYFFYGTIMSNLKQFGNLTNFCPLYPGYYYTRGFSPEGHAAAVMVSLFASGYFRLVSHFYLSPAKNVKQNLFTIVTYVET